jgi:hypothetical protein
MRQPGVCKRAVILALSVGIAACGDSGPTDPAVESLFAAPRGPFTPGSSYQGRGGYIEYVAGNLPVIVSAPHGGTLAPEEIPDRTEAACGGEATTVRDTNTEELIREIGRAFFEATGRYPHLVINRLHRRKLDPNRAELEAACGVPAAQAAFREFQAYIDTARARVTADHGKGWYTDLHGHGHAVARIELGYLLTAEQLRSNDAALNGSTAYEDGTSIRTFSRTSPLSFAELLRGPKSLGALLQSEGFPAVPSPQDPAPLVGQDYFSGGFNVDSWGCVKGGPVCGVQIESHFAGVRDTAANRSAFARALVRVYAAYLKEHAGLDMGLK